MMKTVTDFNLQTNCHIDGKLCEHKVQRLEEWKQFVKKCAVDEESRTFYMSADMFHGCPIPNMECIRRDRCLTCMKRVKSGKIK